MCHDLKTRRELIFPVTSLHKHIAAHIHTMPQIHIFWLFVSVCVEVCLVRFWVMLFTSQFCGKHFSFICLYNQLLLTENFQWLYFELSLIAAFRCIQLVLYQFRLYWFVRNGAHFDSEMPIFFCLAKAFFHLLLPSFRSNCRVAWRFRRRQRHTQFLMSITQRNWKLMLTRAHRVQFRRQHITQAFNHFQQNQIEIQCMYKIRTSNSEVYPLQAFLCSRIDFINHIEFINLL